MSPRVHHRGRLPGALVALAASIALAATVRAAEPWQFPDAASESAAERLFTYWYESYPEATRIIDNENFDKLDEAIDRLRFCISSERESARRKRNPKDRTNFEYFPYYYLARAFAMKQETSNAKLCLKEEAQFGEIASSRLAGDFDSLRSSIEVLDYARSLLDHAATVEGWSGGQGGVSLSADGRQRAGSVKSAADALQTALASPQNSGPLQAASDRLMSELTGLCEGELSSLRGRLQQLGGAPWRAAFPSAGVIDPQVCDMPGGTPSPDRIANAQAAVAACSTRTVQALRTAGGWACGELENQRNELSTLATKPYIEEPPALPAGCNVGWAQASLASLQEAIDGLDLATTRSGYQDRIDRARTLIAERQAEELAGVTATLQKVARPSRGCVTTLSLTTAMRSFEPLPSDPEAALAVPDLEKKVDDAMGALVTGLGAGVQRLRGRSDKGDCAIDFAPLDQRLNAFTRDRRDADLNALCTAAANANREIGSCWEDQIPLVQAEVERAYWPLQGALENYDSWEGAPAEAAVTRECLSAGERALRRSTPGNEPSGWVERMQTEIADAEACLLAYEELRQAAFEELSGRVSNAREALQSLNCDAPDASAAKFCGDKQQVESLHARLATVASLWADGAGDPRQILAGAGMDSAVPADWLQRYEGAQGKDDLMSTTRRAIGDRALGVALGSAANLASWEKNIHVLKPFLALSDAFSAFERGEVNQAIFSLREAQSGGAMPSSGKAAALSHAALSYFLFVKSRAGTGDAVTTLLEQDARQEAHDAVRADASFQLNENLFANVSFRTFFEDCCGNATR